MRYEESEGDKGPQASTLQIVNKAGVRASDSGMLATRASREWTQSPGRQGRTKQWSRR